jgi:predicted Zn-dependent protease
MFGYAHTGRFSIGRRLPTCVTFLVCLSLAAADDNVVRAMKDELARSMKKLQLENLQKPYFIAYRLTDSDSCVATASFGALVSSACPPAEAGHGRSRQLAVEVRVGDYNRDNTNFYAFQLQASGVVRTFVSGGMGISTDDDYDEIRRQLWLATDAGYKQALDVYAKKKAVLENRTRTDDAPDFSKEEITNDTESMPRVELSRTDAESTVKALSALFRQAPGIDNSQVQFAANNYLIRYLNSEGTSYTRQVSSVNITANADTQASDGMPLTDFEVVYARSLQELPSRDEIAKRIRDLQARLQKLRTAALVERYTGPVLFEGRAAAEVFTQGFAAALVGQPRLVVDDVRFEKIFGSDEGSLIDKVGGRVLPDFLSLTDNAAAREFQGKPLLGGYQVDEDGVKARPTLLVDNGILQTLLHTRALIHGTTQSSGSRRGPGAAPSNLIVTANKSLSSEQLKAELIRLVKQRNKEYGIVVRRLSNSMLAQSLGRSRTIFITSRGAATIEVEPFIEAYKVFPDGHEELVRNLSVLGLTLGAFKDIVAVSDTPDVYTIPFHTRRVSPVITGQSFSSIPTLVSIATPSLLFDEMTLQRPSGDVPNLPFTKHPFFEK